MAAHWLAELQIGGQVLRWSHEQIEVLDGSDTRLYKGGIVGEIALAQGDQPTISVVDPSVDWPAVAVDLPLARSRLLLWEEGTDIADAQVFADGVATSEGYGARHDPVGWVISHDRGSERTMPHQNQRIDNSTWPITTVPPYLIPEEGEGTAYPVIFGTPGDLGEGGLTPYWPVPVTIAQYRNTGPGLSYVVLSGVPLDPGCDQVLIRNDDTGQAGVEDVSTVQDLLQGDVWVADFTNDASPFPGAGEKVELYCGFVRAKGGGLYTQADEVIRFVLERWGDSRELDWARLQELDYLSGYRVDAWVNEPVRPWDWLEGVLLPALPVVRRRSSVGWYLERVVRYATARDAIASLDSARGDWLRTGPVTTETSEVYNVIPVEWGFKAGGTATRRLIATAAPGHLVTQETDERLLEHPLCKASQALYRGERVAPATQVSWTWDRATAARCLQVQVERHALPARVTTAWIRDGGDLREGSVLLLTDEDLGWSDQVAIVAAPPVVRRTGADVTLRIPRLV